MEADRFGVSDWLKSIGGVAFFTAGLLPWWEQGFEDNVVTLTFNAFSYSVTGLVPYVIFVAIAIFTIIIRTESLRLPKILIDPLLTLVAAAIGTVLVGIRFFMDGYDHSALPDDVSVTRGIGLYLAAVSALVVLAGSLLAYRDRHAMTDGAGDVDDDDDETDALYRYDTERARARRPVEQPPLP